MNLLGDLQGKKQRPNNQDFNRFVKTCLKELEKEGKTICFTYEQIEALKIKYNGVLKWKKNESHYIVEVVNVY